MADSKVARDELSKAETAKLLGLSERAVARHAEAGRLTPIYYDRPQGGREVRYSRGDVERLKQQLQEPRPSSALPAPRHQPDQARQLALISELAHAIKGDDPLATSIPLTQKLLVTISEASFVTGLGVSSIERAIADGLVEARTLGPRGIRVLRQDDLSKLVASLWTSAKKG